MTVAASGPSISSCRPAIWRLHRPSASTCSSYSAVPPVVSAPERWSDTNSARFARSRCWKFRFTLPPSSSSLTQQLIRACPDAQFFHVDVSLPQRYFYDRELFPLVHCEVDLTVEGRIQSIQALESPWDTDYGFPPLTIMELSPDSPLPNPNHGGRSSLVVRMDGEERVVGRR